MKHMKKVFALMLAVIMTLTMSVTAFAAKDTAHQIAISSDAGQKEDHSYEAYQIFVGTYDTTSKQLQNFAWGDGVNTTGLLTELKTTDATSPYYGCDTAAKVAAVLNGKDDDSPEAKAFAEAVSKNLVDAKKKTSTGNKTSGYTIDVVGDGYYFIKDSTDSLTAGDTYSSFMLQVIGDTTVKAKDSTTQSQKQVKDADDTAGTTTEWQDSADYDIGDKVPFKLTGKVAADYDKYTAYVFTFHDEEGDGLTFNNDAKVYVDGQLITEGYQVKTTGLTDDCTFEVQFANLKSITSVKAGSVITVEYTSTLNEDAVVGQKGNPNKSHIEFSNNPNGDQSGTGTTPDDTVIVFTYKSTVTKYDETEQPLNGADFTLYKEVQSTYPGAQTGAAIKATLDAKVKADDLEATKYYVQVGAAPTATGATQLGEKTGDSTGNVFEFNGIDDGTYVLVETTIPSGYNAWSSAKFVVEATHAPSAEVDFDTGKVAGSETYVLTQLTGDPLFGDEGDGTVTLAAEKADLDVTIVNKSGSTLPETGGMGTTRLYVIGAILVVGAGIILVTRRRMSAN